MPVHSFKGMEIQTEDKSSEAAMHQSPYESTPKTPDYSATFDYSSFQDSNGPLYGSVTKHIQDLLATGSQVINIFKSLECQVNVTSEDSQADLDAKSGSVVRGTHENVARPVNMSEGIIDLNSEAVAYATSPFMSTPADQVADTSGGAIKKKNATVGHLGFSPLDKEGKVDSFVIVLDSDEEDGNRGTEPAVQHQLPGPALIGSVVQKCNFQKGSSQIGDSWNHLVQYDKGPAYIDFSFPSIPPSHSEYQPAELSCPGSQTHKQQKQTRLALNAHCNQLIQNDRRDDSIDFSATSKPPFHSEHQSSEQKNHSRSLALESQCNQLIKFDRGAAHMVGTAASRLNVTPSVLYEKVVLTSVSREDRLSFVVDEDSIENGLEGPSASAMENNIKRRGKKESSDAVQTDIGRKKRQRGIEERLHAGIPDAENPMAKENFPSKYYNKYDEKEKFQSDGLEELWKDMAVAMEFAKSANPEEPVSTGPPQEDEEGCDHSFELRDEFGLVCSICGVIQKRIETIFDYQWSKASQSTRTYAHASRDSSNLHERFNFSGVKASDDDFIIEDISIHPRHSKLMKPHQLEGFNFLVKNLVNDRPGGCILAHAPGSGKTFMLISFIQSFLAKYPSKRPLVVLPKGILPTWKKEFQRWQVEDIPFYDFYSAKADSRYQQLQILKCWQENKSILFLGYKQFSTIIFDHELQKGEISAACQEILLKVPSLLILDEGHTPRNENTNVLDSLAKIQTPCKVVLSGTLFQNHVREVFTILNLVRPKFLKMESSRAIVKRMMSRLHISNDRRLHKGGVENTFFDLVEENMQSSNDFKRKVSVIQDLREMTKDVLHYYKGDFLDELPGLVDFTVLLNLSLKQKVMIQKFAKFEKFKKNSVGSAVYMHPQLYDIADKASSSGDRLGFMNDQKIDHLLDLINPRDGVKTKFFLNLVSLAESAGEKVLAFSQYILPLKYLERLLVTTKGWQVGKEIFVISGDTSSEVREWSMDQFNHSHDAKVFFGSIKACGEGISLVGASRVVILDVHLNPSVTRQAIGRAFRPGQTKKVYVYRLVAADSPEEEDHNNSFSKELISKMWFEWSEFCGQQEFELDAIDISSSEDMFLENSVLSEDIKTLYRR